ncbi:hypothetical protein FKM82_020312 [Ascaphus truei]
MIMYCQYLFQDEHHITSHRFWNHDVVRGYICKLRLFFSAKQIISSSQCHGSIRLCFMMATDTKCQQSVRPH